VGQYAGKHPGRTFPKTPHTASRHTGAYTNSPSGRGRRPSGSTCVDLGNAPYSPFKLGESVGRWTSRCPLRLSVKSGRSRHNERELRIRFIWGFIMGLDPRVPAEAMLFARLVTTNLQTSRTIDPTQAKHP
jgi:hypothetical protein